MTTTTMTTTTTTTARQQHQRCGWSSTIPSCLILLLSYCGLGVGVVVSIADTATAAASLSSIATTTTTSLLRDGRNAGDDIFLPTPTVAIAPRDIIMRNKRNDEAEHSITIVARILEDGDESNEEAEDNDESNEDEEEDDDEQQSQEDENDDDNDNDDDAAAAGGGDNYYYYDDAYMNNGSDDAGSSSTGSSSSNIDNSFIQIVLSDLRERFDSDMYQFWEISPSQWDANMREDCVIMLGIVLAGMILPCIICLCCYCFCCRHRRGGGDVGELPYLLSQTTTGGSATDYTDDDDDGTETDYSGISKNYTTDYTNFTAFTTKSWENPFVLLKDFSRGKTTTNKTDTIRTKDEEEVAANTTNNNNNNLPITTTAGKTRPTGRRKNELTLDGDGLLSTYNPVLCDNLSPMSSNSSDDILKTRSTTATQYSF